MDDYKIAVIYGDKDENRKRKDGVIAASGSMKDGDIHIMTLLNFVNKNFSDVSIFKKLNLNHGPETVCYFLNSLGHIVFLNTSVKKVKSGMLFLPNDISSKQKKALYQFMDLIDNYEIFILYNLVLEDGLIDGEQIQSLSEKDSPKMLLDSYFELTNTDNKIK